MIRLRHAVVTVVLAALTGSLVGASPLSAESGDWRTLLAASAEQALSSTAAEYKRGLEEPIAPLVEPPLTGAELHAVTVDADLRYADGGRPLNREAAELLFRHDKDLAVGLEALLNRLGPDTRLLAGAADLLAAERMTVEAMLADARLVLGAGETSEELTQGQHAFEQALAAWRNGQPVSSTAHFEQAADRVFDLLERLGVAYDGGDRDGDGIPDLLELRAGASPLRGDTDGDGLGDRFEIAEALPWHLPGDGDTDGDGQADPLEDLDRDGLNAIGEQAAGTKPVVADTDRDDLADGAEVETHGTAPTDPDSDDDGLDDGAEIRAGTDPLAPDSDGDGIADGADVNTATVTSGDVAVALTGVGDLSGGLDVRPLAGELLSGAPGQAGPAYDLTLAAGVRGGLQRAEIEIAYDPAAIAGDEADLRLFVFDEERQWWQPVEGEQTVDEAANTVRAAVEHFSIYAVFDIRNWNETWTALGGTCDPRPGGGGDPVFIDVAFVLDSSGSMVWNDPQGFRRTAAKIFVDAMHEQDRGLVVDFDSFGRLLQPLTSNKALLKSAIDRIDSSGGTNIGAGVSIGVNQLIAGAEPPRAQLMILLTDGVGSYNPLLTRQAADARITIYTIGLGSDIDEPLLRGIAEGTGGTYHHVANAEDLPDVFRRIEDDTGDDGTDTDGDGLTDCQEEEGMRDSAGFLTFTSDPRLADTDGDGLTDGEEVGEPFAVPGGARVFSVFSDPRAEDTDSDGLSDPDEADAGSRARSNETDGDGLSDLDELSIGTDPTITDTDGDGYGDGQEHLDRDGGFDPLTPTEVQSGWDYAAQFARGALCGDVSLPFGLCDGDSIAFLAGHISGGLFVVTDIRDAIANLFSGDLVGAGLSIFSAVPWAGDAASVPIKVVKFIGRTGKAGDTLRVVMRIDELPSWAKIRILEELSSSGVARLRAAGVGDDDLIRLARAGADVRLLDDALAGAARAGQKTGFLAWRDAETTLRTFVGAAPKAKGFPTIADAPGTLGYRFVDAWDPVTRVAREAKTGFTRLTPFIQRQIDRDVLLRGRGTFAEVEWHFFPSAASESLGPSRELLDELRRHGIPYVIHVP